MEAWLQTLRARGVSPKTLEAYGSVGRTFLPWAQGEGLNYVADLDKLAIERFAIYLQGKRTAKGTPLAPASRKSYLRSLAQFLSWCRQEYPGLVDGTRTPGVRLRKARKDVLSRQELHTLEQAARTERDRLIIRIMGDLAAREGEIANLGTGDVLRLGRIGYLRISGKTGERMVPLPDELYRRLVEYREHRRPQSRATSLFLADRRRPDGSYEGLTEGGIYQAVRDAAKRARLPKRVYPHLLRASAITQMTTRGMHPALVSDLTGVSVGVISTNYSFPSLEQSREALLRVLDED